jgi:hypothetical protein
VFAGDGAAPGRTGPAASGALLRSAERSAAAERGYLAEQRIVCAADRSSHPLTPAFTMQIPIAASPIAARVQ